MSASGLFARLTDESPAVELVVSRNEVSVAPTQPSDAGERFPQDPPVGGMS